jgi:uncharacterized membrane protein
MKILGHNVHPIVIVFPLGLLSTATIMDALHLVIQIPGIATAANYMILAGLVGSVVAMFFGLLDMYAIRQDTRAMNIVGWHSIGNFVAVDLYLLSWLGRQLSANYEPSLTAIILSFAGAGVLLLTGWFGGELVYRMGVAVDSGANQDSSSSLSGKPASSK